MNDSNKTVSAFRRFLLSGWHPYAWIAGIILLVYFKTLAFDFTRYDDNRLILGSIAFLSDPGNIPKAFLRNVFLDATNNYYRPLLTLSFMWDAHWGGASPFWYHVTNIAIHVIGSLLLFSVLKKLGRGALTSFVVASLFAVHPALTQAVAWVPGRNDSLLAVFVLASFRFLISFYGSCKPKDYLGHIAFFLLALFVKETALGMLVVFPFYGYVMRREQTASPGTKLLLPSWGLLAAVFFVMRHSAAVAKDTSAASLLQNLYRDFPVVIQYVGKIFLPFNLAVMPTQQDTTFLYGLISLALLIPACLLAGSKRNSHVLFGALWFLVFLLPTLTLPANVYIESRLYLPMAGFCFILPELIGPLRGTIRGKRALPGLAAASFLLFGVLAYRHSDDFSNMRCLWEKVVATSPHLTFARGVLARIYVEEYGLLYSGEQEFKAVLKRDPGNREAAAALEEIQGYKKEAGRLAGMYDRYIGMKVRFIDKVYYNYALLAADNHRDDLAEALMKKAIESNPGFPEPYRYLMQRYFKEKKYDEAVRCARQVQRLKLSS